MQTVSIVVPCYNAALYVEETLQSLLMQTYQNLEIIVINDGSTDETKTILNRYAKLYPTRMNVIHQENLGQSKSLNKGWALAKGSLLGYLSSDDILDPSAIQKMTDELAANHDVDILYPDYRLIDPQSRLIKEVRTPNFSVDDLVVRMLCQPGPGAIFRKTVFRELSGWRDHLRQMPDYDFWLRASQKFKFKRFAQSSGGFRVHDDSQSFQSPNFVKSEEPIEIMKDFLANGFHADLKGHESQALAQAYILSARLHLRAWRFPDAIKRWLNAVQMSPSCAISLYSFKLILHGLLDRPRFFSKQLMRRLIQSGRIQKNSVKKIF